VVRKRAAAYRNQYWEGPRKGTEFRSAAVDAGQREAASSHRPQYAPNAVRGVIEFMSALAQFISANRRASRAIEAWLPGPFRRHLHTLYKYEVAARVNGRQGQVVLDIGCGRECPFLPFVQEPRAHRIIGIDCSSDELRLNPDLDIKVVANAAAAAFPIRDATVDLVVSRSVIEHLNDNDAFFANCARVLRPGGALVHTFPCKFAPFALINQILPNALARRLIAYFHPQWTDECGFPAFYDKCYFSAVRRLLERNGFENPRFTLRFYQSIYFDFFVPLYALMLLYDLVSWGLGVRNLACAILVTAEQGAVRPARSGRRRQEDAPANIPESPVLPESLTL
jgi:ubiquinone/menaquinone biosynthesis C-methylase UbiE